MRSYTLAALCLLPLTANAISVDETPQLNSMETTSSITGRAHTLQDTPASVYIIKGEEIRRMGFKTLAEALRLAPGVQVARRDANKWSISIRGFQQEFNNKILVLVNGQIMNNNIVGGTYWDTLDTLVDNIERIEILKGPQAVRYGSNAMNGVINIYTKNAQNTQGWLVNAGASIKDKELDVRYGEQYGEHYFRVFGRFSDFRGTKRVDSRDTGDGFHLKRLGFQLNGQILCNPYDITTEWYHGTASDNRQLINFFPPSNIFRAEKETVSGGKVHLSTSSNITENETMKAQLGYLVERRQGLIIWNRRDSIQLNVDFNSHISENNYLDMGLGLRNDRDSRTNTVTLTLTPAGASNKILTAYLQDEYRFTENLTFNAGSNFEFNDYTDFESQRTLKGRYKVSDTELLWSAVSSAVRTPSRLEKQGVYQTNVFVSAPPALPIYTRTVGNDNLAAEEARTIEIGYKNQILPNLNLEGTAFSTQYSRIILGRQVENYPVTAPIAYQVDPILLNNARMIKTYGAEFSGEWIVNEDWQIRSAYHYLGIEQVYRQLSPRYQFNVRTLNQITDKFQVDSAFYYVGKLPTQFVKDYMRLDLRMAYVPVKEVEVSFTISNMTHSRHREENLPMLGVPSKQINRSYFLNITAKS